MTPRRCLLLVSLSLAACLPGAGLLDPSSLTAQTSRPPFQEREINQQYRRLLEQLADGTGSRVVALHLRRVEEVCHEYGWWDSFKEARGAVTEKLERLCGPDCLVPLLYLQQDLVLEYLDNAPFSVDDLPRGASLALYWVEELEEFHTREDKTEEGARMRADFSAAFGQEYRDRAMVDNARMRFHQALKENPRHREALHMLASLEEKLGLYGAARPALEELVALDPTDAVAQLRLALVEARTGKASAAETRLAGLLEAPSIPAEDTERDWVRRLAYQERAVLLAARDDRDQARRLLRRGLEEYPQDQPMVFALAFYTEDRPESRRILEDFAATPRPPGLESARGRYNNWPSTEVADLPVRVHATLERTREKLAQGLVAVRSPEMLP